MSPRVSVVMSVLNGEEFLRPAIDSVLAQSFEDFELVVIDNASTDSTPAILDSYADPRLTRLRNESTITLTQSLNKGLAVARGEYVARLDADDIALPSRLAEQVAFLDAHSEVALLGSAWRDLMPDGRLVEKPVPPLVHAAILDALAYQNPLAHSSLIYRRDAVLAAGGYPTNYAFAQDKALYLRLVAAGQKLAILPTVLLHLRQHAQQFSLRPETALLRASEEEALLEAAQRLPNLSVKARRLGQRALASVRAAKGFALWRAGRRGAAVASWLRAIVTDPVACLGGLLR